MSASAPPGAGPPTANMPLQAFTPSAALSRTAAFLARHGHLVALALFAAAGVAVLDDYGLGDDEFQQRKNTYASFDYIVGAADSLRLEQRYHRYYGVAFELPLIAVERALGLEDFRAVHLSRHLISHLFFLVGGFFAWLLAHRLFGNRLVAFFAMLIFLLHPRLYAHSFFNSKDPPFLAMFMVSLYLIHRAFRRDSVWAFALCGAGLGLLTGVRVVGVVLLPAVLGMLALDAVRAAWRGGMAGTKPALAKAGALVAASAAALYACWPLLWSDPLELISAFQVMSAHPESADTLFRGELVKWPHLPPDFIPTWALITTPPVALILAALGIAGVVRLCAARPRAMLENSDARFGLLAVACLTLPVAGVVALNANLYNGWRQMYFLYAPACVLAAFGLRELAALPKPGVRAAAFALIAVAVAAVAVQMVRIHPYQNEYFNILVDKSGVAERWQMGYWRVAYREAAETILEMQPDGLFAVSFPPHQRVDEWFFQHQMGLFPESDRRIRVNPNFPLFQIVTGDGGDAAAWKREVYGVPLVSVIDLRAQSEAAFNDAYESERTSERLAAAGGFAIHRDGDSLVYLKENCGAEDTLGTFQLIARPSHRRDLPNYEPLRFDFWRHGAIVGGRCLISVPLPDYPIHAVETEKWTDVGAGSLWRAVIPLADSLDDYAAALANLSGEPAARADGGFDMWLDGGALIYVKRNCAEEDAARGRFFLSIFPADSADLPPAARDAGREHESLNFDFHSRGAIVGGDCVIIRTLPDYPVSRIETGQWTPGEGELWSARIAVGE